MRRLAQLVLLVLVLLVSAAPEPASAQSWNNAPESRIVATERPAPPADWIAVRGTWLTVHGHPDRRDLLLRLSRHGASSLDTISDALGVPIGDTVHVYVSPTQEVFRELQPGTPPEWADATAYPRLGAVYLRDPRIRIATDEPVERTMDHEFVHVLLGRAFAPSDAPRWLQEGVAQVYSGQVGPTTTRAIQEAALRRSLIGLEALERSFPKRHSLADLAYAESADFVQFLQGRYGEGVVTELVAESRKGHSLRTAVFEVTGEPFDDVESAWRNRWTAGVGFATSFLGRFGEYAFGAGGLLLVVAGIMRRLRFRRRLREMEDEEALVDAVVADMRRHRPN